MNELEQKKEALDLLSGMKVKPKNKSLIKAVLDQEEHTVELLLKAGVSPDATYTGENSDGNETTWQALTTAIDSEAWVIVKLLLEYGANPNLKPTNLAIACEKGNLEVVKLLIEKGANINWLSDTHTPLICAINSKNESLCSYLIEQGSDVNFTIKGGGNTHWHAKKYMPSILPLLEEKGAKPVDVDLEKKLNRGQLIAKLFESKLFKNALLFVVLSSIIYMCMRPSVDYSNPDEVKQYLTSQKFQAKEGKVYVILSFSSTTGSLESYYNGSYVSRESFSYELGQVNDNGSLDINTSVGKMTLETSSKISYKYKGEWYFFWEWDE